MNAEQVSLSSHQIPFHRLYPVSAQVGATHIAISAGERWFCILGVALYFRKDDTLLVICERVPSLGPIENIWKLLITSYIAALSSRLHTVWLTQPSYEDMTPIGLQIGLLKIPCSRVFVDKIFSHSLENAWVSGPVPTPGSSTDPTSSACAIGAHM